MIIAKEKALTLHKEAGWGGVRLKKLSQKFLLGAVCAGLMLKALSQQREASQRERWQAYRRRCS